MKTTTTGALVGRPLPDVPAPFTMPFYYANLCNCGIYYQVDVKGVQPYLKNTGLAAAVIEGRAVVSFNFQLYAGEFSSGVDVPPEKWSASGANVTQELELNILAYPEALAAHVAQVNFRQYMLGEDQSKLLGNHRVHVACDSTIAIQAGEKLFGEPKFKTTFKVNIPSYNPGRARLKVDSPVWQDKWGFRVDDPNDAKVAIFTCVADATGLTAEPASVSPITEYGSFGGELIGCRWELLNPMLTYFLDEASRKRVQLTYGASKHPMKSDMEELIGSGPAAAVQTFLSAPAAIQNRAYYP
jgi:hypothetical protein